MHLINKKITSKKKNTDEQKIKAPKMCREGQKKAKEGNLLKERKTTKKKKKKLKEIKKGKWQKKTTERNLKKERNSWHVKKKRQCVKNKWENGKESRKEKK